MLYEPNRSLRNICTSMNEITAYQPKYIILFFDDSIVTVSEQTGKVLIERSVQTETFTVGNRLYNFKAVKSISPEGEFYEQHPDKRPRQKAENWTEKRLEKEALSFEDIATGNFPNYTPEKRERAREGLIKGLQRFIDRENAQGRATPKARALREHMKSGKKEEAYANVHQFDPSMERWPEFSQRVGLSN